MKTKLKLKDVIEIIIQDVIIIVIGSSLIYILWDSTMCEIFNLSKITFKQAFFFIIMYRGLTAKITKK